MSLLQDTRWIKVPVSVEEERKDSYAIYFRKVIDLSEKPGAFPVRITADSRYKLYVNHCLAFFGPMKGDDTCWFADRWDLAPWLKTGKNVIAVEVLAVSSDSVNSNHSLFTAGVHGLYTEGLGTDGWRCHVCGSLRFVPEEEGFAPLHIHENAAQDPEAIGWRGADFDDSRWQKAVCCKADEIPFRLRSENLRDRTIPAMERIPHCFDLPVREIPANTEQSFVLDAGEEMTAFLRLGLAGGRGAKIELLQSECYVLPSGKGNRLDSVSGRLEGYADQYTVGGQGDEVYEPYWFRTFRFLRVMVRTAEEPLSLRFLEYEETGYPLEVRTEVSTSDDSLRSVWDISLRTLRRCMQETYTDCPFYEQLQYIMDTRSQALYTYAVSADDRLARQALDDFRRSQREDGLLNACYPNKNANVIPGFSLYYIFMLHDHMMYFGDRALIRDHVPAVERILHFFREHIGEDGLVQKVGGELMKAPLWSFIDWATEWLPTSGMPAAGQYGPLTMESLLYLMGLQKAAEMAEWLCGEEKDPEMTGGLCAEEMAAEYRNEAQALRQAIRLHCMDADGMLTDGPGRSELSQHAQVFGVLTGTLTKDEGKRNLQRAFREEGIAHCTVAMAFYLFRALEETGLYEYTDDCWDIWRDMVKNGCTTCVEAADYARSECHAWGALALYELPSVVLGVRPAAPGYEKISVWPHPGALKAARGKVYTPKGDITVEWEIQDGQPDLHITCEDALWERFV